MVRRVGVVVMSSAAALPSVNACFPANKREHDFSVPLGTAIPESPYC
jgi:hypothetical protein